MICTNLGLGINRPASGARGNLLSYLKSKLVGDWSSNLTATSVPNKVNPPMPDAMVVEGAGTASSNEILLFEDIINGRNRYVAGSNDFLWDGSKWVIYNLFSSFYESTDDVVTPDLATTWTVSGGDAPAPTVRRATWADIDAAGIDRATVPLLPTSPNNAVLKTGFYASSDGVADKLINADCSGEGSGTYRLTGMVRTSGFPIAVNIVDGEDASQYAGYNGNAAWEEFTSQEVTGTPANVILGFESSGGSYLAADWSDVRLQKDVGGVWTTVAHWTMATGAGAANLDTKPELDVSGNGYHGVNIGGAGGSGEADILQTAGMDFNGYKVLRYSSIDGNSVRLTHTIVSDPAGGTGNVTRLEVTASGSAALVSVAGAALTSGVNAEVSLEVYIPSTNTEVSGVWLTHGFTATGGVNGEVLAQDQWVTVSGTITPTTNDLRIQLEGTVDGVISTITASGVGDVIYIRNLQVVEGENNNFLVPASDASPSLDALGNAIAKPRVNNKAINLFNSSCKVEIADADSLDLVNDFTFEAWVDVYGVPDVNTNLITKGALLYARKLAVADELTTDFTPATGHAATVTDLLADGISCLHFVQDSANGFKSFVDTVANASVPAATGDLTANTDPLIISGADGMHVQVGSLKLYDAVLTTDQLTKNYNAQAVSYGLSKI